MNPRTVDETTGSLDDLELELRRLPGVRAAGFDERDDMLLVQLHVGDRSATEATDLPVPVSAVRIAARHSDRPVAVEIVRWRAAPAASSPAPLPATVAAVVAPSPNGTEGPSAHASTDRRPRLLAVLTFPETDELEVHLNLDGKRTIGRAPASSGLVGAVEATIDALRALGAPFQPYARWARALDDTTDQRAVVAVALDGVDEQRALHYGLAAGSSAIDAAARSTLDALNRRLSRVL